MLPPQAAEVVKEKNPSGMIEVVTKIVPGKVSEIVNAITPEKFVVALKLEKQGYWRNGESTGSWQFI